MSQCTSRDVRRVRAAVIELTVSMCCHLARTCKYRDLAMVELDEESTIALSPASRSLEWWVSRCCGMILKGDKREKSSRPKFRTAV